MNMKLLTFVDETTGKYKLGVLTEKGVLDISGDFETLQEVMAVSYTHLTLPTICSV